MTFCGSTVLPIDFDILRPFSSSVKRGEQRRRTAARAAGAAAFQQRRLEPAAVLVRASRYITVSRPPSTLRWMPARPGKCSGLPAQTHASSRKSNQTSQMSSTFFRLVGVEPRKRSARAVLYQASAPSSSNASAMRVLTASSCRISARTIAGLRARNTAIGTPRRAGARSPSFFSGCCGPCPLIRFSPDCGTHCVTEIACSAGRAGVADFALRVRDILVIAMNHCGVLRKDHRFFRAPGMRILF